MAIEVAEKVISFDVMARDHFVSTIKMPVPKDQEFAMKDILRQLYKKHPTLKYERRVVLCFKDCTIELEKYGRSIKKHYQTKRG